jgi:hypothetical protein
MEKKKIKVSYEDSGVKTLNGFGVFFFVAGTIALVVAVIGGLVYLGSDGEPALGGASLAGALFPAGISLFAAGAVCTGLSSIARTALYKRMILEYQYDFVSESYYDPKAIEKSPGQKFPKYSRAIVKATGKRVEIHNYDSAKMKYICTSNSGFFSYNYKSYTEDELEPETGS